MIQVSDDLIDLFNENYTVKIGAGAFLEHNMNSMLQNITVTTTSTDQEYINQITPSIKINPFKKLFPVDSIIKPFRPRNSGVKYYVDSDSEYPLEKGEYYSSLRVFEYPSDMPRVYYAGTSNDYKYFLTPKGKSLDVTIKYVHKTINVTEAYSNGKKIFFKTSGSHGFTSGLLVSVTGLGNLSVSSEIISSVPETNLFTIDSNVPIEKIIQNGTATLDQSTKPALANRILVKFEEFHYVPNNCYIYIKKVDQPEESLGQFTIIEGKVDLHYRDLNGTKSWTRPGGYPWTLEDFKYSDPVEIESIRITAPGSSDKMIGLIELSPRWIKDISEDVVSFEIQKESSVNSEDILPIGKVTSNSLSISLARYKDSNNGQDSLQIVNYNFDNEPLDPNLIYMFSKSMIIPYFKIFHNNAIDIPGVNDFVPQGEFYLDSWEIKNRGDTSIEAFDAAKILMDAFAPERYYESFTAVGILTALLDSVGFTSYNFNLITIPNTVLGVDVYEDLSIPVINYWWSDGTKSVWECIQEICNDIQMNAIVDEDGILQFYSRDYMYQSSGFSEATFTYDLDNNTLPNIISFSHKEIPSANQVKVIYDSPFNSNLVGTSENLFVAPVSYLAAGALLSPITTSSPIEGEAIEIQIDQLTEYNNIQSPFAYQGYVVINSEIIEYDAIEYKLILKESSSSPVRYVWVESEADVAKYRNIARSQQFDGTSGSIDSTFAPSNKLRVKKRGALGTTISSHELTAKAFEGGKWKAYKATWA